MSESLLPSTEDLLARAEKIYEDARDQNREGAKIVIAKALGELFHEAANKTIDLFGNRPKA